MSKKYSIILITLAVIIVVPLFFLKPKGVEQSAVLAHNVFMENGKQIVVLKAKGGYIPLVSTAKAGVPTVLRLDTNGTFDCSASIRIPSLGINKILPATGTTDFDLGIQKTGVFTGSCGMGMYPFRINFE